MGPRLEKAAVAAVILVFIALAASSASTKSATADEFAHLPAALYTMRTGDFSLYNKTPPLGRMAESLPAFFLRPRMPITLPPVSSWRPWVYATLFQRMNAARYEDMLVRSRYVTVVAGAVVCFLVFLTSRKWYGQAGGFTSLLACAFSPTIIAHSRLVTTDVMAALATFLFMLALVCYLSGPSLPRVALVALALGLATAIKFTCLLLGPVALAAALASPLAAKDKDKSTVAMAALHPAALFILAWLVVAAAYGFDLAFIEVKPVSSILSFLHPLVSRIPLPPDFLYGLDRQLVDAQGGEWSQGSYLLGEWRPGGAWYYYLVAIAVKEPVPYLAILAMTLIMVPASRPARKEWLFLAAAALWLLAASMGGALQVGIRYLLPAYPLVFVLMGKAGKLTFSASIEDLSVRFHDPAARLAGRRKVRMFLRGLLVFLAIWATAEHALVWPHYLAYFNPLAGGSRNGYQALADSNLDWGQDLPALADWMRDHQVKSVDLAYFGHDDPARFGINYDLPGRGSANSYIAISANFIVGMKYPMMFARDDIKKDDPLWDEVRKYQGREPKARLGYTIFVYDRVQR